MVEGIPTSSSLAANERPARAASHMNPHSSRCTHQKIVKPVSAAVAIVWFADAGKACGRAWEGELVA